MPKASSWPTMAAPDTVTSSRSPGAQDTTDPRSVAPSSEPLTLAATLFAGPSVVSRTRLSGRARPCWTRAAARQTPSTGREKAGASGDALGGRGMMAPYPELAVLSASLTVSWGWTRLGAVLPANVREESLSETSVAVLI